MTTDERFAILERRLEILERQLCREQAARTVIRFIPARGADGVEGYLWIPETQFELRPELHTDISAQEDYLRSLGMTRP